MSGHVRERMSAYIDRELAQSERAGVESHLRDCAECTRAIEEMRAVDVLARGHEVEAPAGYFEGLPTRLRGRLAPPARARVAPWMVALAAGVAAAVVGPLVLRERPSPLPATRAVAVPSPAPTPAAPALAARAPDVAAQTTLPPQPAAEPERGAFAPAPPAALRSEPGRVVPPVPAAAGNARRQPPDAAPPKEETSRDAASSAGQAAVAGGARPQARSRADERRAPPRMTAPAPDAAVAAGMDAAAAEAEAEDDAPLVSDNSGPERELSAGAAAASRRGALAKAGPADPRFQALAGRAARSAAEARALRDAWQAYVRDNPEGAHADAARVAALEAGAAAWRLGGAREDRAQVERDGREYLRRPEAADKERVRALLAGLEP